MAETKEEKRWKRYKNKRNNGIILMLYCVLFLCLGMFIALGSFSHKEMYNTLKDDKYLTDDGLPYRDMENATYTYPVADINDLASQSDWALAIGTLIAVASIVLLLGIAWVMPEKTEMHILLCKGEGEKEYCPECGLKLSRLEKD